MNPQYKHYANYLMICIIFVGLIIAPSNQASLPVNPGTSHSVSNIDETELSYTEPLTILQEDTLILNEYNENRIIFSPEEFIVKFKKGVSITSLSVKEGIALTGISSIDQIHQQQGICLLESIFPQHVDTDDESGLSQFYKVRLRPGGNFHLALRAYIKNEHVEYAEPNYVYDNCIFPNDPMFDQQWALHNIGQTGGTVDADIDAPEAWNVTTGNGTVTVAVIDTGVDWDHPDLAENIWVNPGEDLNGNNIVDPGDFDGIDSDGNGFIDDLRGWDFVNLENTELLPFVDPREDAIIEDNNPMDFIGHGTHCAGIVATVGNNNIGVAGVNWNCSIMPVRAAFKSFLGGSFLTEDIIAGIGYAADNGADVISMSFGGSQYSLAIQDILIYTADKGVINVAAAGNSNTSLKHYPAAYDRVIAVAATDHNDEKARFSNYGSWVDIAAPGVMIKSTMFNDSYAVFNGTSMACPHVAGVVALMLSKNSSLSEDMITTMLFNTVDDIDSPFALGSGRVNAHQAVLRKPVIAKLDEISDWTDVNGTINITGTAWGETFYYYSVGYFKVNKDIIQIVKIHESYSPIENGVLAVFNTTNRTDGAYTLWVHVLCSDGEYDDTFEIIINNEHNVFYIDDDNQLGPWYGSSDHPYQCISDGAENAGDKDTIIVRSGLYNESVHIYSSLRLEGEDKHTTIVSGSLNDLALWIEANHAFIHGFTFTNATCNVFLERLSHDNMIFNNIITQGLFGIFLSNTCQRNSIYNNVLSDNLIAGIDLEMFSDENIIIDNIIEKSWISGLLMGFSEGNTVLQNIIRLHNFSGISLISCLNTTIHNNFISDIHMEILFNNKTQYVGQGIGVSLLSMHNTISKNLITRNDIGIFLADSSDNRISENSFVETLRNAKFSNSDNYWNGNYWGQSRLLPKLILGVKHISPFGIFRIPIPDFDVDWRPARNPTRH